MEQYMQKSLLAHIASNFISEYENVANSSITYLLNKYSASQEALKSILGADSVPTYYVTELSTDSNGRPDVTGLDFHGDKTVIIEGKFWANLTDNQPGNYLKEITNDGKILFLAPDKRLKSLTIEIEKRIGGAGDRLVICSWAKFLSLIEKENNKHHNHHLASDLLQISELCQRMDVEGMPPLSASDLDPMNGRVASNFSDVIDECNPILRVWEHSDFKGLKTTPKKYGHGFYFCGYKFGCYLHFDTNKWFIRDNHTPIWLSVSDKDWKKVEKISHYLNDYDSFNSFGCDYGISIHEGMDKNQAIAHIINKVKDVLVFLNSKMSD
jgi:hypothetical protein